jgi:NAD binding domain of 6-phosphogluconate dehydrogenase
MRGAECRHAGRAVARFRIGAHVPFRPVLNGAPRWVRVLRMDHTTASVTVLGLGAMGRALAAALLTAGHPTTAWNRTAAKADALVEQGATRAATPGDAVGSSDVLIACLIDYAAVDEVLRPVAGMLRGRVRPRRGHGHRRWQVEGAHPVGARRANASLRRAQARSPRRELEDARPAAA